ncbi:PAS domain-containing protein [Geomonas nitrogeniifigens]|uniref:histidine kinase n=1 Tax=Geomonas diazotrophica TaxID=2843197 RepID=A0ABX8JFH0_9BACT|nr:PAS domain-containing hybrid sensor histidine kinase/response regulator [Geomonas nitrogeniifigens]QWV95891.1 PAS domain-containing protein [Geomonas nitrogeniifigens]QXE84977.1 PAS domain-containing protein [Geomonas nitrogeniifigens]
MTDTLHPTEKLYRFIIDTIPQIVWTATPDGAQDFANLRWYEFNGLVPGEPDPEPWRSIIHPDDVAITAQKWQHSLATGEPYSCLHRNRRFDGEYRWVLSRAVPQKDQKGRIVRWIGSGTDITEQKVAEAELIKYRDHLEELVRERTEELVEAKERAEVATRAVLEANDLLEKRVEERTAELRRTEKELRQAQKMEAIGTLAAGIAHDFNNILTSILGFTDMVLHKVPEGGVGRSEMEQVFTSAQRAADLVRQILTFSRHSEQERKAVHLVAILDDACRLLRSSLPASIEIIKEVEVPPDEDKVFADPTQLHQVLMNLGTNAAHAMLPNGGRMTVSLRVVPPGSPQLAPFPFLDPVEHLHLCVRDTGRGMENRVLERIFDPYFTTKPAGEGTGLGLAVVQGIVKNHGGAIAVHSEPGAGTCFEVFLPAVSLEIKREEEVPEQLLQGNERILFVDDEESLTVLGQGILENLGYSVVTSISSAGALDLFRAEPYGFDLVITDLTMPGQSGRELAREITALRPDVPVILCTGFKETVDEKDAEHGIRACLMKPYTMRILGRTIRQVLDRRGSS